MHLHQLTGDIIEKYVAWTGSILPSVGHKWCVQAELQALSQLQTNRKQTHIYNIHIIKLVHSHLWEYLKWLMSCLLDPTWSSMVISVVSVLSVFHFWLKLRPRSCTLYLVSRWPPDFPVSVLLEPEVANSCRTHRDGVMMREMKAGYEERRKEKQKGTSTH